MIQNLAKPTWVQMHHPDFFFSYHHPHIYVGLVRTPLDPMSCNPNSPASSDFEPQTHEESTQGAYAEVRISTQGPGT